jgi:nitrogenase subunit NifH
MISYYLLTAHNHPQPETEDEYLTLVHDIAENSEKRVLKVTRDKQLASMISKMLSSNLFELPDL